MVIREAIERIRWMRKIRKAGACRRICLFCNYYSQCRKDALEEGEEK